jgi:N-acetylmuramoyl-L-alanine amidase
MSSARSAGPQRLTLDLRMAFSLAAHPGQARWAPQPKPIPGARVRVQASGVTATTNRLGKVTLALAQGADQVIEIEPADTQASSELAGPSLGNGDFAQAPALMLRPFQVVVDVDENGFTTAPRPRIQLQASPGTPPHALVFEVSSGTLVLDWKPDWIKAGNRLAAPNKRNDYLVIHRTGSMSVGSAINTFTNSNNTTCIHYLLDVDGHVVKLAHENDQVNHTGPAFWQGVTQINARSIGIEVVHGGNGDFPDAQYTTLLRLVREIRAAHPNITRQNVVGHSDIATESTTNRTLSNRRIDDPGDTFDWARLENAGQVRRRTAGPPPPTAYGLRPGEYVTQSQPNRNGATPEYARIQSALLSIGYSVAEAGTTISDQFDGALEAAVRAFQRRHFSGSNAALKGNEFGTARTVRIDFSTAFAIQMVAADSLP